MANIGYSPLFITYVQQLPLCNTSVGILFISSSTNNNKIDNSHPLNPIDHVSITDLSYHLINQIISCVI